MLCLCKLFLLIHSLLLSINIKYCSPAVHACITVFMLDICLSFRYSLISMFTYVISVHLFTSSFFFICITVIHQFTPILLYSCIFIIIIIILLLLLHPSFYLHFFYPSIHVNITLFIHLHYYYSFIPVTRFNHLFIPPFVFIPVAVLTSLWIHWYILPGITC